MRILVLSHMYPKPYNPVYGIFIHHQVKELVNRGCEAVVLSPVRYAPFPLYLLDKKWKGYRQTPTSGTVEGIPVYYPRYLSFPFNLGGHRSGYRLASGAADLVARIYADFKFDLIHAHVALPSGYAALLLKEKYPVPVVVTIHGVDLQSTIHRNQKSRAAVGTVIAKADHIVTVSNKLRRIAVDSFGHEDKITTIANGIFPLVFPEQGGPPHQKIMLSVSNLIKSKGIDLNLKALAALKDRYPGLLYRIVGAGPDRERLQKIVKELNLEERVQFLGSLPNREAVQEMSKADVFSLPSWREGFGVVYIEALSQGRPVIACRGEGIEDVIEHGENGLLVEPQDVGSLTEALDYLLTHREEADRIGASGQKKVLAHYTWAKNVEKTRALYRRLLGSG